MEKNSKSHSEQENNNEYAKENSMEKSECKKARRVWRYYRFDMVDTKARQPQ